MRFSFRRSRPWQLLLGWSVYWVGLALLALRPAIAAGWRLSQANGNGTANAGITDGILSATIIEGGRTAWAGSISVQTLALLVAVPPLLLWLVWLAGSARTNNASGIAPANDNPRHQLRAPEPGFGITESSKSSTSRRRAR